ncbi:5653_t:CDS:1, partial [Paraglomus occultum]
MNRAYQIHIERIQAHDSRHQNTSQAYTVLQTLDPDLSCQLCYPGTTLHRSYRNFWNWYKRTYYAQSYSQQTATAHLELINSSTYSRARAAARDIIFSCRYNIPIENPKNIVETLLVKYTRYTLQSHLPLGFEATAFDIYIEFPASAPTLNPYLNRTPEEALGDL